MAYFELIVFFICIIYAWVKTAKSLYNSNTYVYPNRTSKYIAKRITRLK